MYRQRYAVTLLGPVTDEDLRSSAARLLSESIGEDVEKVEKVLAKGARLSQAMGLELAEEFARVCQRAGLKVGVIAV